MAETNQYSRMRRWTGHVLTGLSGAFLIFDACMKLLKPAVVVQGFAQYGYPDSTIIGIGVVLLLCALLYLVPRTSILGAVLVTGYLGGAVATNVRVEQSAFNTVAPVFLACIAWGGLWLRETSLQQMLPLKHKA